MNLSDAEKTNLRKKTSHHQVYKQPNKGGVNPHPLFNKDNRFSPKARQQQRTQYQQTDKQVINRLSTHPKEGGKGISQGKKEPSAFVDSSF